MVNTMISYYESKMNDAYKQWQIAVDTDKPISAKVHKKDYENYKELRDAHVARYGMETMT